MTSEWIDTTIGDQVLLQRGFDITKAQQHAGNIPVVSSGGISSYHNVAMQKAPGVVLGRKGTLGTVFFLNEDYWPHDTTLWVKDFKGNNPTFVYYFFKLIANDLLLLDNGSANPTLNRNHVHPIRVNWPPIDEQRAIAKMLGALDDKIELNRRMNKTLEAMAAAIFKSWFVDFDPVIAKSEGRQPFGMSPEVAALFPDSFVETEDGSIPKGWIHSTLGNISVNYKHQIKPYNVNVDTPYIGLEHMPRRNIALHEWGYANSVCSGKYSFQCNDILFGKLRPYFHKVGVAPINGVCSTDILVLRPKGQEFFGMLLGYVSSKEFIDYVDASSGGTRMPRTDWSTMKRYKVLIPSDHVIHKYNEMCCKHIKKIQLSIFESKTLADLRDRLLPKLLSGDIQVKQAEIMVEVVL